MKVLLTLMTKDAIFFPLYSTILHSFAVGSDDEKGGGERDLKLKHNYFHSCQKLIKLAINFPLVPASKLSICGLSISRRFLCQMSPNQDQTTKSVHDIAKQVQVKAPP